ncbi:hypothetical protein BKA83DRAFT_4363354 [Pisolithus microcarpus]|nr:hypothetical protein BKA83DRAFT_4363354 [Pisolithus microcarpus]
MDSILSTCNRIEDKAIILLIGSSDSGKFSFIRKFTPLWYCLRHSARHVTATEATVRDKNVILLDTPDIGSVVNGREVVELDIFNLVKSWLRKSRCNALLAGILYFQSTDSGQAVRPDIDCFREICDSTNFYSFVVLVATGKRLIEAGEIETWNDAVRQGAKTFLYLDIKESAEEAIMLITQ